MKISNFLIFVAIIFLLILCLFFNLTNNKPLKVAFQHQTKNNTSNEKSLQNQGIFCTQ